jgi:plasmid stabilization system protein ParE
VNHAFHPDAEAEYLEAIAFYETRRPGLGTAFIAEVEHLIARICDAPLRYPVERQPDVRAIRLQRFPYKVLFREHAGTVQILALAHDRRRPGYWLGRL